MDEHPPVKARRGTQDPHAGFGEQGVETGLREPD